MRTSPFFKRFILIVRDGVPTEKACIRVYIFEFDFVLARQFFSATILDRSTDRTRPNIRPRRILLISTGVEGPFENSPNSKGEELHFIHPRGVRRSDCIDFLDFDPLNLIRYSKL